MKGIMTIFWPFLYMTLKLRKIEPHANGKQNNNTILFKNRHRSQYGSTILVYATEVNRGVKIEN